MKTTDPTSQQTIPFRQSIAGQFLLVQAVILLLSFGCLFVVYLYSIGEYRTFTEEITSDLLKEKFQQELQSSTETAATLVAAIYKRDDLSDVEKPSHTSLLNVRKG